VPVEAGRILTTHVGSLPRPQDVVDLVLAEDRGEEVDRDTYDRVVQAAVTDRVRHQVEAGVDLVSDGEMSKIGYATYIRHRLSGFETGDIPRATPADLDAYPAFRDRLAQSGATLAIYGQSVADRSRTNIESRSSGTCGGSQRPSAKSIRWGRS
jgi:5-methyltetrahydropteroyltriglutamate--homocysteine methyltransferase